MKLFSALVILLFLTVGCATIEPKVKIITVDKPIAMCPPPPDVPTIQFKTDLLKPEDLTDPGKIGEAYKYDMTYLRSVLSIYKMILEQYANTSKNYDEVNKQIDSLILNLKQIETPPIAP